MSPQLAEHLVRAWQRILWDAGADSATLFHLHHLTPQHEAIARSWPDRPVIAHLHGTELKMLQAIADRRAIARTLGSDLAGMPTLLQNGAADASADLSEKQRAILRATRWEQWRYGEFWARRLRANARSSRRLIVVSTYLRDVAVRLLGVRPDRIAVIPNGVDIDRFDRRDLTVEGRLALLRRWLVDDPQGWDERGAPGSIRYRPEDLEQFIDPETGDLYPILLFVGRFTSMKRVPLLIRAYRRARPSFAVPAPLLIWGGSPGEWEGEHPYTVAREEAAKGIFFSGWRGHDDLALGLNCADVMVAPSRNEPFGQVYLEAMASGLPVIATRSGGPPSFVNARPGRPNGWLIAPDDEEALACALIEAVNDRAARAQRADNAYRQIRGEYSWDSIAGRVLRVYREALSGDERSEGAPNHKPIWALRPNQNDHCRAQRQEDADSPRVRGSRLRGTAHHDSIPPAERRPDAES